MIIKRYYSLSILIFVIILAACSPSESSFQSLATETQLIQTISTTRPSDTPRPTDTLQPTPISTPIPEPLTYSGTGDSVVDISTKWDGPAIVHAIGPTKMALFQIRAFDSSGKDDLIVNALNNYDGRVLIQALDQSLPINSLEVEATGSWSIEILPFVLQYLHTIQAPGTLEGEWDDVILVLGSPSTITAKCDQSTLFQIYAYTETRRELLFNDVAPYEGTKVFPKTTNMIEVFAGCKWSIDLK